MPVMTTDKKSSFLSNFARSFKMAAAGAALALPMTFSGMAAAQESAPVNMVDIAAPAAVTQMSSAPVATFTNAASNFNFADAKIVQASVLPVGPIAFGAPWLLLGMLAIPALWFLMRLTPPTPRTQTFPGLELLRHLAQKEEKPAQIPWWLQALRLSAASLVVLGLAQPMLNPETQLQGDGPLLLVVDNGWASSPNWDARVEEIAKLIDRAERDGRGIMILTTAPDQNNMPVAVSGLLNGEEARTYMQNITPHPWGSDRVAAADAADDISVSGNASVVWLSDGLDSAGALDLAAALQDLGPVTLLQDDALDAPLLLGNPRVDDGELSVTVQRADGAREDMLSLSASTKDGRVVDTRDVYFPAGQTQITVTYDIPDDLRAQLTRISINGEQSAGAVVLLDEQWRHRPVGLLESAGAASLPPLLSEFNYIERALQPYTDMHRGNLDTLLSQELAVMVVADAVVLDDASTARLDQWVREGGTVLRFAGPRLASSQISDGLLPVDLRPGERALGGAMSWDEPAAIAPFPADSPFAGLQPPSGITIERQVLAQPGANPDTRTWARLEDGTPLVSAEKRGDGWLILVHTTANTGWSNLALSGLFVDMLRAVVDQSRGVNGDMAGVDGLPPWQVLDAKGRLSQPASTVEPLSPDSIEGNIIGPRTPPGFYGNDSAMRAHNLASGVSVPAPLPALPDGITKKEFAREGENHLTGPLLAAALAMILADLLIVLRMTRSAAPSRTQRKDNKDNGPAPTV